MVKELHLGQVSCVHCKTLLSQRLERFEIKSENSLPVVWWPVETQRSSGSEGSSPQAVHVKGNKEAETRLSTC